MNPEAAIVVILSSVFRDGIPSRAERLPPLQPAAETVGGHGDAPVMMWPSGIDLQTLQRLTLILRKYFLPNEPAYLTKTLEICRKKP
jgi:hypothetical protein